MEEERWKRKVGGGGKKQAQYEAKRARSQTIALFKDESWTRSLREKGARHKRCGSLSLLCNFLDEDLQVYCGFVVHPARNKSSKVCFFWFSDGSDPQRVSEDDQLHSVCAVHVDISAAPFFAFSDRNFPPGPVNSHGVFWSSISRPSATPRWFPAPGGVLWPLAHLTKSGSSSCAEGPVQQAHPERRGAPGCL